MEIRAQLRYYRKSPRKVRPVIDVIRGLSVAEAVVQLQFMARSSARQILKLLESAIANAENNFKLTRANLFVKTIMADGGPVMKRFTPRAMGRATPVRKRTTHVTIVLEELKSAVTPVKKISVNVKKGGKKSASVMTSGGVKELISTPAEKKSATKF